MIYNLYIKYNSEYAKWTYFKVFVIVLLKIVFHRKIYGTVKVNWTYGAPPNTIIFLRIYYTKK